MGIEPPCPPNDGHTGFEDRETHRGLSTPAASLVPDAACGQVQAGGVRDPLARHRWGQAPMIP